MGALLGADGVDEEPFVFELAPPFGRVGLDEDDEDGGAPGRRCAEDGVDDGLDELLLGAGRLDRLGLDSSVGVRAVPV